MSSKPESKFIAKIHRRLKPLREFVYAWKIHNQGQNGIADCYYSGAHGDHWIEYKYIEKLPVRDTTPVKIGIDPLQQQWLGARHREGRKVALVIGCPIGVVILDKGEFPSTLSKTEFISSAVPFDQLIEYILRLTDPRCLKATP